MIHSSAIVDPKAKIHPSVDIGPWTLIGPDVEIGEGCKIAPHVVIKGPTKIGKNNTIYQFASIGEDPQDKKFAGGKTYLEIGDNNLFREYVSINRGTEGAGGITKIGNNNLFMAYVHVAHDCIIGSHTVFANNASLAGHVHVADNVNIGGFAAVFQFTHIGEYAFLGGGSMVIKNIPPYVAVSGYPAKVFNINSIALERANFPQASILALKKAYKILYRRGLSLDEAIAQIEGLVAGAPELDIFVSFLKNKYDRGIVR